jgi:hypothetical protein
MNTDTELQELGEDEFPEFEELVPEFEALQSFFSDIEGVAWSLEFDRRLYEKDPKAFDVTVYRESGELASLLQRIEEAYYGSVEPLADDAWDPVS